MTVLSVDPGIRGCGAALWSDAKLVAAAYVENAVDKGSGPREAALMATEVVVWTASKILQDDLGQDDGLNKTTFVRYADMVSEFVCEYPQTYGGRSAKGDPTALFPLAAVDAAIAVRLWEAKVISYVPHDWKESIEKPKTVKEPYIIEARVRDRLLKPELDAIVWPRNVRHTWDVTDAIGVGLKHLGRFERRRVYARE